MAFGSPLAWIAFVVFVLGVLALDLGILHRKDAVTQPRAALVWTAVWIALAMAFTLGVYFWAGPARATEFLTGYALEKALSIDNLFVILLVFSFFGVPAARQHRVLLWGIAGALIMRGLFILLGASLLHRFHWLTYAFGGFLVFTAFKLLRQGDAHVQPGRNPLVRLARRIVPVADGYAGGGFTTRERGRRVATPLLLVLVAVESTDVVFAVDSIPAIFGVTDDAFVVFTSNIFALLGLRSLYFALAGLMHRFHYLKYGLALVLAFVGVKMLLAHFVQLPIAVSLGALVVILGGSIVASLLRPVAVGPQPQGG